MAVDKKEVAMWVAGVLASAAVAFLIYRLERNSAAQNAANAANAEADQESALANQQAEVASLPSVSVPTISSQPSSTDTTNQASAPANESALYDLLGSLMGADNSPVTSQSNPVGSITELPLPTSSSIPAVTIPAVNNFASAPSNNSLPTGMSTFSGASNSTVLEPSGLALNTNVAKSHFLTANTVS